MDVYGWNEIIDIVDRNINIRNKLLEESQIEECRIGNFCIIIKSIARFEKSSIAGIPKEE